MRILIQRVNHASVTIEGEESIARGGNGEPQVNSIGKGYLVLVGIGKEDDEDVVRRMWAKTAKLRLFEDADGKTNLSLADVSGELLVVSQFTLYANCKKGNRPSFTQAATPARAEGLYELYVQLARKDGFRVKTGWFGAMMAVDLENDGPFTVWLDSECL